MGSGGDEKKSDTVQSFSPRSGEIRKKKSGWVKGPCDSLGELLN